VAYSGGRDSTVLLHALAGLGSRYRVRALHVNHGLQPEADGWAQLCQQTCEEYGIQLTVLKATVDTAGGKGLEAAAREARYSVIRSALEAGEVVLTAHHQRDQLETFLLQALRGGGVRGLAAMPASGSPHDFPQLRPMLTLGADLIAGYAAAHGLRWVEDPSNADISIDRNYLRHKVLPNLYDKWPEADQALSRSARLCAEAAGLLDELAQQDCAGMLTGHKVSLPALNQLTPPRQRNALRFALRQAGLPMPSEQQLRTGLAGLLGERGDSQPELAYPGARIRRYREHLWIYSEQDAPAPEAGNDCYRLRSGETLELGTVRGRLRLVEEEGAGVAFRHVQEPLEVRFRAGGERLRPAPGGRTRDLKKLLQESDIVPWMRGNIPLVYSGSQLLFVGDRWLNSDLGAAPGEAGVRLEWQDYSPLS